MQQQRIFTVSELNGSIRGLIETHFPFINVVGEISNLRKPMSGHIYFTLKDDRSQIKAVLFKMQQRYLKQVPKDGQMVVCRGRISVYEPRGDYQLIIDALDTHGAGALQLAFEELKQKLAAEGLFDEHIKKPLPAFPRHITLVTAPHGAAVHDFIKVARGRFPQAQLAVYPVAVQGDQAGKDIARAIFNINEKVDTDIIVLCRGGGSIEDLWAFNEEQVGRAIHGSKLPVVSAVGHEIDFTIADFAADLRAPTPSAAAELILPDIQVLQSNIDTLHHQLVRAIQQLLDVATKALHIHRLRLGKGARPLDTLFLRLDQLGVNLELALVRHIQDRTYALHRATSRLQQKNPLTTLQLQQQTIETLRNRMVRALETLLDNREQSLQQAAGVLDAVSPLSTLARGYAIVRGRDECKPIIRQAEQVVEGGKIEIILHRGELLCTVNERKLKTGRSERGQN